MRDALGATVVVVTHELASIFAIGNNAVFLDADTRTMTAVGDPKVLREDTRNAKVRRFLLRGEGGAYSGPVPSSQRPGDVGVCPAAEPTPEPPSRGKPHTA